MEAKVELSDQVSDVLEQCLEIVPNALGANLDHCKGRKAGLGHVPDGQDVAIQSLQPRGK